MKRRETEVTEEAEETTGAAVLAPIVATAAMLLLLSEHPVYKWDGLHPRQICWQRIGCFRIENATL